MNNIVKIFAICVTFCFSLVIFSPKINLYYAVKKDLKKHHILITNDKFVNTKLGFNLENAYLHLKGINIGSLDNVEIVLNSISISSQELGWIDGKINIFTSNISIKFKPTAMFLTKYKVILKDFTKQKNGVYEYEYKLF